MKNWRFTISSLTVLFVTLLAARFVVACSPIFTDASSGGERIAFVYDQGGRTDIFVMSIDGRIQKNLTEHLSGGLKPAWSPDGKFLSFTSYSDGVPQIFVMKSDGSHMRQLTHDKNGADNSAWSPDGRYIIFTSNQDGILSDEDVPISEIYIMTPDGLERRRLTNNLDFERHLSWSPKGNLIAVSLNARARAGIYFPEEVYLMGLDGKIQDRLTDFSFQGSYPSWSPDGELILFSAMGDRERGICVMRADGTGKNCLIKFADSTLSDHYVSYVNPAWSPDGTHIIFSSNRDGDYDLYTLRIDGSELTQITNLPGDEIFPVWSR